MLHRLLALPKRARNLWSLFRLVGGVADVRLYNRMIRGDLSAARRSVNILASGRRRHRLRLRRHAPIFLREFTADAGVFGEVVLRDEYAPAVVTAPADAIVVDLGANIGMSMLAFQLLLKEPRIIGIEPDRENCELARLNSQPSGGSALVVHGAIGPRAGRARLHRDGMEIYEFKTEVVDSDAQADAEDMIRMWTVPELLAEGGVTDEAIDILKCDIEGAEAALFGADDARMWLDRVKSIVIELHDPYTFEDFRNDLLRHGWQGSVTYRARRPGFEVCVLHREISNLSSLSTSS